jgi:succinyl-CoA synthetase beta subunit
MNLHEYQARDVLAPYGLHFPRGDIANSPQEAEAVARRLGGKVMVKAQVHVGGRGKAGGVHVADTPEQVLGQAASLLGKSIGGHQVRTVLLTEMVAVAREFYLGATLDRVNKGVTFMGSGEGGIDIEETARLFPERIVRATADPFMGLADYQALLLATGVGLRGDQARSFASVSKSLLTAFLDNDCSLLEINPLALTGDGGLVGLDAKMVIDDNALFRHPELARMRDLGEEEPLEARARQLGVNYVRLEGTIGCVVNGAGLAMATMDVIEAQGGKAANFLDFGGGIEAAEVATALRIVLADENVRAILFNVFGGITRCDVFARGLVSGLEELRPTVPIVVRLVGTNEREGREILQGTNVHVAEDTAQAAHMVIRLADQFKETTG